MNKHTSTHEGVTATRNSKHRIYTHVVWTQLTAETKTDWAVRGIARNTAQAAKYRAQAAAGGDEFTPEKYIGWAEDCEAKIVELQARLDAGIGDDEWLDHSWAGRLDLAQKEARRIGGKGYRTAIEPAVVA